MTRFLAFLALLPLLALVAAVVMVSRTCPTHASVSRSTPPTSTVNAPAQPSTVPTVAAEVDPSEVASDAGAMQPETKTPISDPTTVGSPSTTDTIDIASALISPPAPSAPPLPATSAASPTAEPTQKLELLQLEVSLLRDTNRDLLKAIEALKLQLANAQAEITNLQAMLPVEDWLLEPVPAPSTPPTTITTPSPINP